MGKIHETAIIGDKVKIGKNVTIGAYCVLEGNVTLEDNVELMAHVFVTAIGKTIIGAGTKIFPFASIGTQPQDLKYDNEKSELIIGKNNTIREHVTMNPGTKGDHMITKVGDNNLFMVGVHIGHDCIVGNNCIFANNSTIAGHVIIEDFAILGGLSAVHQFVRIGTHSMIGGVTGVEFDVIPFGVATGDRAKLQGLNLLGLKRRGFSREEISAVRKAYGMIFVDNTNTKISDRINEANEELGESSAVKTLINFMNSDSKRSLCLP